MAFEFDIIEEEDLQEIQEVDLPMPGGMGLRDYQVKALEAIEGAWKDYRRIMVEMCTGAGKTILFSKLTEREVKRGGRVLILAHSEELIGQAADKLKRATGLDCEREKADEYASTTARVVVASIQTLSKDARLMAFPPGHFSLVIVDETHRILAKSYLKVVYYFHFGAESLNEDWIMPGPGESYNPLCRLLGVTATADRGDRRNLGQIFESCVFTYGLIDACRDGYLVRPLVKTLPLKIDLKGIRTRGNDFDAQEISERLSPLLREIARQIAVEARHLKTIIFLPSIDSAQRLAEACAAEGLNSNFVSGACPDRTEKMDAFKAAGRGSIMCNAMLLVEGVDIPDISCVCMLRPTKIRGLFVQATGRGTRTLPGTIDGLNTKEERLAAIAASAKPSLLILDFLWLSDRLDLVKPVDLVAGRADLKEKMSELQDEQAAAAGITDLLSLEEVATRDLLKSLERAAKANANKAARVVDPLLWAVDLGDIKLASYEPESDRERRPPTPGQIEFLRKQHFDVEKIKNFGMANKVLTTLMSRFKLRLASPAQLHFLHQLGLPAEQASMLTAAEATKAIDRIKAEKEAKRAAERAARAAQG